jgi:hypothetical protein
MNSCIARSILLPIRSEGTKELASVKNLNSTHINCVTFVALPKSRNVVADSNAMRESVMLMTEH